MYGSVNNRFEENKMYTDEIKVGTGMTEYGWSDRKAYEVIEVRDQKHIKVREYDHILNGEAYTNDWKLISNPENPTYEMVKRGNYWYQTLTLTADDIKHLTHEGELNLILAGFSVKKIREKGKQTVFHRWNVSFGVADYYYDYEF